MSDDSKKLTSRERVMMSVDHKEPDRVPIDLGGVSLTSMHQKCYRELVDYLGLDSDIEFLAWMGQIVKPPEEVLERYGVDTRSADVPGEETANFGEPISDCWGTRWELPKGGDTYIARVSPLQNLCKPSLQDLENFNWPRPQDILPSPDLDLVADKARTLRSKNEFALMLKLPTGIVHQAQFVRGFDKFLKDMVRNPVFVHGLLGKIMEIWIEAARLIVDAAGDLVDIVAWPDDIGTQNALMFSPHHYREYIKPRHKAMVSAVKENHQVKVFYHTDGDVHSVLEDFVEVGIDILNPVQTNANNMDPKDLKRMVGDSITFWGGIDTHDVLPQGSVEEVKEEVKEKIEVLAPGGGYVLASVHNILPGVPPENILAMLEGAKEYGSYG